MTLTALSRVSRERRAEVGEVGEVWERWGGGNANGIKPTKTMLCLAFRGLRSLVTRGEGTSWPNLRCTTVGGGTIFSRLNLGSWES